MFNERAETPAKYHIDKSYLDSPVKLGDIFLVQVGRIHFTKDFNVKEHLHRNWFELTYIIDGKGYITTNGSSVPVKAGDIYLSFPCDIHAIHTDKDHPLKYQFLSVWPENEKLLGQFEEIMLNNIDPEKRIFADKDVEYLMGISLSEALLWDEHSNEILLCALKQILCYVIRDFTGDKKQARLNVNNAQELCYQLIHYISTHIYVMDGLDALAESFGYSYSYLSDLFRKTTDDTLINFYTTRRLEAAAMLLKEDNLSVGQIAELLKYSSIYTFSRAFKKRFSVSPTEYKKLDPTAI